MSSSSSSAGKHKEDPPFANVILVGSSGVGKTSIVKLLQNIDPADALKTTNTVGAEVVFVDYKEPGTDRLLLRIIFWDTGGQERFAPVVNAYFRGADAVIAVYDLSDRRTLDDLRQRWLPDVRRLAVRGPDLPVLLIGNKRDLIERKQKPRAVTPEMASALASEFAIATDPAAGLLVETSARDWRQLYDASTPTPIDFFIMRHVRQLARTAKPNSKLPLVVLDGRANPLMTRGVSGDDDDDDDSGGGGHKTACFLGSCEEGGKRTK